MDFSRLDPTRFIVGTVATWLLVISILFFPWYSLDESVAREPADFLCGQDEYSCTGFETFPILRWFLLAAALAPLILSYIIVRGHKLSWAPGEATMVVGFTAAVLIFYNGVIDKPGAGRGEIGVSLDWGYWVALLGAIGIAATAFLRSQAGQKRERKAPGTV